jgi:hypothetical protein
MTLSDLAALGSFVSGVAVMVSLVFLYFQVRQVNLQVRQAERNQRATIAQVRAGRSVEAILTQTDASVAAAFRRGPTEAPPTSQQPNCSSSSPTCGRFSSTRRTLSCSAIMGCWRMRPTGPT